MSNTPKDWKSPEFRENMREQLREALEERLRKEGEIDGVLKLRITGIGYTRLLIEPTQTTETIEKNVMIIEKEAFRDSRGSKDKYMGIVMKAVVEGVVFPNKLYRVGRRRWCLEDRKEVCKEVIKVDKKLVWAECMEYQDFLRKTVLDNNCETIPIEEKELLQKLAFRDFFRAQKEKRN